MRLQVYLSHNGVCSRREAMDIIKSGRVSVDGRTVREPSTDVQGTEDIRVDGQPIKSQAYSYVMLHKPGGYTTTKDDPHAQKIVMQLLPGHLRHLSPVGRLDRDSEGLLLLTNDGQLALKLTHPKYHLDKTYQVRITGKLKQADQNKLEKGVILPDSSVPTAPCRITDVRYNDAETSLTIVIHEGRKRQIRTMFFTIGHKVVFLKRVAVGGLALGDLKMGEWRQLTAAEIKLLKK
jgi:23S rRNA pseudouridine2605 synthase